MKIEVREKVINIKTTKMAKKIIEGTVHINHTTGNKNTGNENEKRSKGESYRYKNYKNGATKPNRTT